VVAYAAPIKVETASAGVIIGKPRRSAMGAYAR